MSNLAGFLTIDEEVIYIFFSLPTEGTTVLLSPDEIQSKKFVPNQKSSTQHQPHEGFDLGQHINCPHHF